MPAIARKLGRNAGREFEDFVRELASVLVRPDRRDERPRYGKLGWIRQRIESINDTLKGQLWLDEHGGRTHLGVSPNACSPTPPRLAQLAHRFSREALAGPPGR